MSLKRELGGGPHRTMMGLLLFTLVEKVEKTLCLNYLAKLHSALSTH